MTAALSPLPPLEVRLEQASEIAIGSSRAQKMVHSWLDIARIAVAQAGFQSDEGQFVRIGERRGHLVGTTARFALTDPVSGGIWQLQSVLCAFNKPAGFGQVLGSLELLHLDIGHHISGPRYLLTTQHLLMHTEAFEPESVVNEPSAQLAERLNEHMWTASEEVFAERTFRKELQRFRIALEGVLCP